jgi:CheY-like chemotaxis protein
MYLPRSYDEEAVELAEPNLPIMGGSETILVAEDDEGVRAAAVEMLKDLGYGILEAPDAAAAWSVIDGGAAIDLLFTDVIMPGPMRSAELAKKAEERLPHIGVLFTSGYTENSIVHDGKLDHGVQLLSKPYSREQLARKIRNALDTRPAATTSNVALGNKKEAEALSIVVVEDEPLILMATLDMIEDLGHSSREAGSGEDALRLIEDQMPDILVTDLGLPGMGGEAFSKEVRRRWPDLPIVFATGKKVAPVLDDQARTALLEKPFGVEDLRAVFASVWTRR